LTITLEVVNKFPSNQEIDLLMFFGPLNTCRRLWHRTFVCLSRWWLSHWSSTRSPVKLYYSSKCLIF